MTQQQSKSGDPALRIRALDFINDGVMIVDNEGGISYTDPALNRKLGLPAARVLKHIRDLDEVIQLGGGRKMSEVAQSVNAGADWSGEASCISPDKHAIQLEIRARPLNDSAGQRIGAILIVRDITRERSMERQVVQSQQMELVENLAIGIAHEFKNLLTVIMAYSSLLQEQFRGTPTEQDVEKIVETAQRANELTGRMLAVTRRATPKRDHIKIQTVLNDVAAMLKKSLPKNVTLQIPEKTDLPEIYTDAQALNRALLNLCLNGRDAMPNGGALSIEVDAVTLTPDDVEPWPDRAPGRYVTIAVTDNGIGMAPAVRDRIFEPFFTTKSGGTGLGLSVVQHTLRSLGGWVSVYSEPGIGTCVRLYVPATDQEAAPAGAGAAGAPPAESGRPAILAVDDDPLTLNIAQRILQKAGYRVHTAAGGEEAIGMYRQMWHEIDLVVLDLIMPYVNGEEVYQEMRRINPNIKALIVSGFTPRTAEQLAKNVPAPFLSKPFTIEKLTATVRAILEQPADRPAG